MPSTDEEVVIKPASKGKLERVVSADGSCIVTDADLKFIAMNSNLSLKEVRSLFSGLLDGEIDKETFRRVTKLCYPNLGSTQEYSQHKKLS